MNSTKSSSAATTDFLSRATTLVNRGFSTIPLLPRDKRPVPGIGANSRSNNLDVITAWSRQWPDGNAAVCADDNITILESDDLGNFKSLLAGMGITLPVTLTGGASENRPHFFFKRTPACGDDCLQVPGVFEFRNRAQYVVGPGSIHPSGAEYRFWNDAPVTEIPDSVVAALRSLSDDYAGVPRDDDDQRGSHIQPGPYSVLRNAYLRRLDPADMLAIDPLDISEGERHYTLQSLAGLLHDGERSAEEIVDVLREVQEQHFATPKSDEELLNIASWTVRLKPTQIEPTELPSFTAGTWIFKTEFAMQTWLKENQDDFAESWDAFGNEELPEQRVMMCLNGEPMLREQMIAEIFAYRGRGKSVLFAWLIRILTRGGSFLNFASPGGFKVLLVDGELPEKLLQSRLREFIGREKNPRLHIRSLRKCKNGMMPALSSPAAQAEFLKRLEVLKPDVIMFDTRTAIFKHDTNNAEQLMVVNEFLMRLRAEGYLVILAHHAGKNGTQRGRTDNDDPLDLAIQLNALKGFDPGCGALGFELAFEKVRYGDRLKPFAATYSIGTGWQLVERAADKATADREAKIPEARRLRESGMSIRKIADELGVSFGTVQGWLKRDQN